jgi:hypothetical protein
LQVPIPLPLELELQAMVAARAPVSPRTTNFHEFMLAVSLILIKRGFELNRRAP